uniref:Uncharacterized protein n=1 Tax=Cacopsylla melanoneura TaxID=428564 RepID=A0A8D8TXR9_9HEMI
MKKYKGTRNWLLGTLHLLGFITAPNFFQDEWKNKLHSLVVNRVFKLILYPIIVLIGVLQLASTFIYAIHDLSEFLRRILETILFGLFLGEAVYCSVCIDQMLKLFDLQDRLFTVTDKDIYRRYDRIEDLQVKFNIVCNVLTLLGLCLETLLPMSERTLYLMTSIYKNSHPGRILLFHVWTAGFIDVTGNGVFYVVYILELFILTGFCMCIFVFGLQMYLVTPLVGQYQMFARFVSKIGAEHRDGSGEIIFYTDVSTGTYLTESQLLEYW